MGPWAYVLGAACGAGWWTISLVFGAKTYGVLGTHTWTGPVAGVATGLAMTALSIPVYRRLSPSALFWYSPLSVYMSIATYGAFIFVIRWLLGDFHPDQLPFQVGLQSVVGMAWGTTFLLQIALPVHALAYFNHRLLRNLLVGGEARQAPMPSDRRPC